MGYKYLTLVLSCLLSVAGWAQKTVITGKVLADDGSSLPGVNIVVKGTTTGSVTDANGDFSLEAAPEDVLVFSFVGYLPQEIPVGTQNHISINMKTDNIQLNEVVVVGYGEQSRRNITNAVSKLDNQVLASAPRSNIGSALQGTLPGLQVVNTSGTPGSTPYIVLRGGANINGAPLAPLVIVDGIIRAYNDIAPEDIASVQILKDASATAIYGARANNGVMLITTKKGKSGKAEITYRYTAGFNQRRQGYKYMNARDYIRYTRQGNLNSGRTLAQVNGTRGYGLLTDPANMASFDIQAFNNTNAPLLQQGWDTVGDPYNQTNKIIFKDHSGEIENLVFRNTTTQDHYINVIGGNDRGTYFASFDYYKEDGVIVGSSYQRYTGFLNGSYKVRPNVEVSTGVNLSTSSQLGVVSGSEINTLYRSLAIWPTFNPWLDAAKTQPNPGNSATDGNPLYWLNKLKRTSEVNRITVNGAVKWDILPSLYVKATGNAYLFENVNQSFQQATATYTNLLATPPVYNTTRDAIAYFSRTFQKQLNVIANYNKTFLTKHNITAMLGAEYFTQKYLTIQVDGQKAPTDDIITANASTVFPVGTNYSTASEFRILSNFGRLNYDYDDKYLVTLVYRQDGVSSLASSNRFGFFPGMSAGWNLHHENFFQQSPVSKYINSFKPRISYGVNGNVNSNLLGPYDVQGSYSSQGNYNGNLGYLNTGVINGNLRWEKSKTTDAGFDMGILDNKVTLLFDYYDRRTSDLLTGLSLPSYLGFGSVNTNLGTLQNKGIEMAVTANVFTLSNGLSLNLGANAAHVQNKVLQLPYNGNLNNRQSTSQYPAYQVSDGNGHLIWVAGIQEGGRLGNIYAFKQDGIFKSDAEVATLANNRIDRVANISGPGSTYGTGKIQGGDVNWHDVDKNDTIDSRDMVYIGNIFPKWTGGFTANLSYKGFNLFTRFDFALGHTIYNDLVARTLGNYQGTFNYIELQKNAWSPTNTNTDIPKVYYADQVAAPLGKKNYTRINNATANLNGNNSRFYEKGDYLACREITLSYEFTKAMLAKSKVFTKARLYMSANNLFYITKFTGPTPEPPTLNGAINGVYQGTYPTPKSFVFGLSVSF
ncbi:MAG: SusC/RagA family TonB-linked outer membrane protein [Bacteroidetes bacterium]|nr:SusC/RagA family TonB-linked outer membrane protein [Bacteroidota bacterium]